MKKKRLPFSPQPKAKGQYSLVFPAGKLCICAFGSVLSHIFLFWRCLSISAKELLINENIKIPQVRVIDESGEALGIMPTNQALKTAYDRGYDLVLIAPQAEVPVCRIMDYGKYRFDREKKDKEARKKQQNTEVKEIQLSYNIDTHDFETKAKHAKKFLAGQDKVKVVVRFRGRQMAHQEIGYELLKRFAEACAELGTQDKPPVAEGKNITMLLSPIKPDKK